MNIQIGDTLLAGAALILILAILSFIIALTAPDIRMRISKTANGNKDYRRYSFCRILISAVNSFIAGMIIFKADSLPKYLGLFLLINVIGVVASIFASEKKKLAVWITLGMFMIDFGIYYYA